MDVEVKFPAEKTENKLNGDSSNEKKLIERYSIVAFTLLIFSVIFISFNLRLLSGIMIIAATAMLILVFRRAMSLIMAVREPYHNEPEQSDIKEDVIADFSHRIREPLSNLVLISEMLMGSELRKKEKELVETFVASTNNMITIVNELTMESAASLKYEPRKNLRYNILSTIQNTIDLYSNRKVQDLDFIFSRKDQEGYECQGDPVILKQILLDIFNSIETQKKDHTIKVTITPRIESESGDSRIISLRIQTDNNIPIINDEGIYGHLASRLIRQSNGVFSQETGNNFSVLNINMPFVCADREHLKADHLAGQASGAMEKIQKELKDLNLLLVEDNLINQKITMLTLKPLVRSIETATNGIEALEKLVATEIDIILLDIQMPVMNGLITAEKIREQEKGSGRHIPIIAITANAMLGDPEEALSAGIDDYISKPFQPAVLIEKIKSLL